LCSNEQTYQQLEKFNVLDLVPSGNTYSFRYEALQAALTYVENDDYPMGAQSI
jgi:SulP family sulfate permease